MRFALRNKTKLINAFGEAYYNELIASINSFQSNYTPDCHYWNEAIKPICFWQTEQFSRACILVSKELQSVRSYLQRV